MTTYLKPECTKFSIICIFTMLIYLTIRASLVLRVKFFSPNGLKGPHVPAEGFVGTISPPRAQRALTC